MLDRIDPLRGWSISELLKRSRHSKKSIDFSKNFKLFFLVNKIERSIIALSLI